MIASLLWLLLGLGLLMVSAQRFVLGASALAGRLRVPPLIVGVIIVGFGTSAPEMLVSAIAAWQAKPGLAIGNAIGSNITNIALILGVTALIRPLTVASAVLRRELPILLAAMMVCWVLLSNGRIDRIDGILLWAAMAGIGYWMVQVVARSRVAGTPEEGADGETRRPDLPVWQAVAWLLGSLLVLVASSRLLVWAAVDIAAALGVSDLVIGLTVVAVGTSLPELAASIAAAMQGEDDLAVGNVVGSNTFNTLAVLGLPGIIAPGAFDPVVLTRDVPIMVLLTVVMFAMAYGVGHAARINRVEGALLLGAFGAYQWLLFG